jgi:putative CocE/NonD family hydrolase
MSPEVDQRSVSDAAWWDEQSAGPPPLAQLAPYVRTSQYVAMRDGVRLAVDVYLPVDASGPLPTVLHSTRYHRRRVPADPQQTELMGGMGEYAVRRYVDAGYAVVSYDARGSGASFGRRLSDPDHEEVHDAGDMCTWIVGQLWSDGSIGTTGISYDGSTAENVLRSGHPAVRGSVVRFSGFDSLADVLLIGGVSQSWFVQEWGEGNRALDRNEVEAWYAASSHEVLRQAALVTRGVAPVDADADGTLLREAVAEHQGNRWTVGIADRVRWRDDPLWEEVRQQYGVDLIDESPVAHVDEIGPSGTVYAYCGWYDSAYAWAAVKRFKAFEKYGARLVLGPWDHGGAQNVDPIWPATASSFDQLGEVLRFFDEVVRGKAPDTTEPAVRYFTMGQGWQFAPTWPPPGIEPVPVYLAEGGTLQLQPPDQDGGVDQYVVNYDHRTGQANRWRSIMNLTGARIHWPDRVEQDARLLVFDSAPLPKAVEVTGHAEAVLYVRSTADDGTFHVYLEEVLPSGEVRYVTEGSLRASHRKVAPAPPVWETLAPYHSLLSEDALPWVPGEVAELRFGLHPVSYLFAAGSRLRIAIGGADRDNFTPVPAEPPTIELLRDPGHPSHLRLPTPAGGLTL